MSRRRSMVVVGDEALFLLALRRSKLAGDGRAEAALKVLETCGDHMRVVPRVVVKP